MVANVVALKAATVDALLVRMRSETEPVIIHRNLVSDVRKVIDDGTLPSKKSL